MGSTIRIVYGNWAEARLVPHVAGLILEKVFGQTVEYVLADTASSMYDMLASDGRNGSKQADLALTLWPANYWGTRRSAALNAVCRASSTARCVSIVGNHDYRGRSGWFITANTTHVKKDLVGWSIITSLLSPAEATSEFAKNLTKAYELKVTNLCEKHQNLPEARYRGFFNWLFIDSNPN